MKWLDRTALMFMTLLVLLTVYILVHGWNTRGFAVCAS